MGAEADQWASLHDFLHGDGLRGGAHGRSRPQRLAPGQCVDLQGAVPAGANGTISCGDWSGCGTGTNGRSWDYETCTYLVEQIGTNGESDMFPPRVPPPRLEPWASFRQHSNQTSVLPPAHD